MNVKEMRDLRDRLSNIVAELNIKIAEEEVDKIEKKAEKKVLFIKVDSIKPYTNQAGETKSYIMKREGKFTFIPMGWVKSVKGDKVTFIGDWVNAKIEWKEDTTHA